MFTLTRNTQYYKALSVNINFLLLGMWQSPVPIGIRFAVIVTQLYNHTYSRVIGFYMQR